MKDYLISQFIDNELDLDEKIDFVEEVGNDTHFKSETVDLLKQEKLLQGEMAHLELETSAPQEPLLKRIFPESWFRPLALFSTGLAIGLMALVVTPSPDKVVTPLVTSRAETLHRFIIYRPLAEDAKIIGTFTNWQPVSMQKIEGSGYWTLSLPLQEGEHQYSYFVEDGKQITDPTILERVQDDFGGQNSIITIKV